MTEAEWIRCTDPVPMLDFLGGGRASPRKLRLFAAACSRRVWGLLDEWGRAAVEVAEAHADGLAGAEEMRAARLACKFAGGSAAWYAAASSPAVAARNAALSARNVGRLPAEAAAQAALLRDVFGNPFRVTAPTDSSWLGSNDGSVKRLAEVIYEQREVPGGALDNSRLGVLADALLGAGYTDAELLRHLRGEAVHVRGCHAVDRVLGRG